MLALGVAGKANAQNASADGLPAVQSQGDITFLSGGVGHDEAEALRRRQGHWPLSLSFFGPTSDYLADVHVRIVDSTGNEVMAAASHGPYMLVALHPGSYVVYARYKDEEEKRPVKVAKKGHERVPFRFNVQ